MNTIIDARDDLYARDALLLKDTKDRLPVPEREVLAVPDDLELTEQDLELVAGGLTRIWSGDVLSA